MKKLLAIALVLVVRAMTFLDDPPFDALLGHNEHRDHDGDRHGPILRDTACTDDVT